MAPKLKEDAGSFGNPSNGESIAGVVGSAISPYQLILLSCVSETETERERESQTRELPHAQYAMMESHSSFLPWKKSPQQISPLFP